MGDSEIPPRGAICVLVLSGKNVPTDIFDYEPDEPILFVLRDGFSNKLVAEGVLNLDLVFTDAERKWKGDVRLDNGSSIAVAVSFKEAPAAPPSRASITVGTGKEFPSSLTKASVKIALDAEDQDTTAAVAPTDAGVFIWNQTFDMEYQVEKKLILEVLDENRQVVALGGFDLWIMQSEGKTRQAGDLAVNNVSTNQLVGKIGVSVVLYDPEKETAGPVPDVDAMNNSLNNGGTAEAVPQPAVQETKSSPDAASIPRPVATPLAEPMAAPRGVMNPADGARAQEAAQQAARDADAAVEAAKAAAVAAGLRPESGTDAARRAADRADAAEKAAEQAREAVEAMKEGAIEPADAREDAEKAAELAAKARANAEDAALAAALAAGAAALREAKDALEKAQRAAMAVNQLRNSSEADGKDPELKRIADAIRECVAKAHQHKNKCEEAEELLRNSKELPEALDHLSRVDQAAKSARKKAIEAEELANTASRQAKKLEKEARRREQQRQAMLKRQEREQEALNALERQREAEREAERRNEEELPLHERAVLQEASAAAFHGYGALEPDFMTENAIPPAACCYIPPNRSKLMQQEHKRYYGDSPESSTSTSYGNSPQEPYYPYDVTAYGVPAPELDILIEGELKNPTCCMCCGIRWNKC